VQEQLSAQQLDKPPLEVLVQSQLDLLEQELSVQEPLKPLLKQSQEQVLLNQTDQSQLHLKQTKVKAQ